MSSARKTKRPPRPRSGELWAFPIGEHRWGYAWVLDDLLVGYFDIVGDEPAPDLDVLVATPIAFRVWTSLHSAYTDGWVAIGRRSPPADLLSAPQFFNADPISGQLHATRGQFGDEVPISVEQALKLEEAAVWQTSHIAKRLRDHVAGFPKKWLESSRLAQLGLLPTSARSSIGPGPSSPVNVEVSGEPRVWLRRLIEGDYAPRRLVEQGQQILATLDERIGIERPVGKGVFRLTHEAARAFNDLALAFEREGAELATTAREEIAKDIEYILRKHGYKVSLEEAVAPRNW